MEKVLNFFYITILLQLHSSWSLLLLSSNGLVFLSDKNCHIHNVFDRKMDCYWSFDASYYEKGVRLQQLLHSHSLAGHEAGGCDWLRNMPGWSAFYSASACTPELSWGRGTPYDARLKASDLGNPVHCAGHCPEDKKFCAKHLIFVHLSYDRQ